MVSVRSLSTGVLQMELPVDLSFVLVFRAASNDEMPSVLIPDRTQSTVLCPLRWDPYPPLTNPITR